MKKYFKLSIIVLLAIFTFNTEVNAAKIHGLNGVDTSSPWSDNGYYVKFKGNANAGSYIYKLSVDNESGNGIAGYCIDYGAQVDAGDAKEVSLSSVYSASLVKTINEYGYYGYGYSGRTGDEYYLATQKLIWEAISSATGHYNAGTVGFGTSTASPNVDVSAEVNAIKASISNHYKTPSMCSSTTKLEIAVDESQTFTDTNGVLANYKVTCGEGIKCEVSGNDLKVTAVSAGADQTITFSKGKVGSDARLYQLNSNSSAQRVVIGGSMPAVTCNFGVDTYENVKTADARIVAIVLAAVLSLGASLIILKSRKLIKDIK